MNNYELLIEKKIDTYKTFVFVSLGHKNILAYNIFTYYPQSSKPNNKTWPTTFKNN